MWVGVGYSDNPDSVMGAVEATSAALKEAGRSGSPSLTLLFATARHEADVLRRAVASVLGPEVPIIGGAAAGVISNDRFGYAGDQIILALFWLERTSFDLQIQGGLTEGEEETGLELGRKLASGGVRPETPVLLFYDAINRMRDRVSLIMATPLLRGLEEGLGFLPDLIGAGLQGDYAMSPTRQWVGDGVVQHHALALSFNGDIRMDSVIMHGCHPATGYYTVTKADQQTILEINGQPALSFMDRLLGGAIPPDNFPFFLIFGINRGERWGEFNENSYASRLCLASTKNAAALSCSSRIWWPAPNSKSCSAVWIWTICPLRSTASLTNWVDAGRSLPFTSIAPVGPPPIPGRMKRTRWSFSEPWPAGFP